MLKKKSHLGVIAIATFAALVSGCTKGSGRIEADGTHHI
jgi:hypothetical protein